MEDRHKTSAPGESDSGEIDSITTVVNHSGLAEEVSFWRELIDSQPESMHSSGNLERMYQALALAEYRLAAGFQESCH
jgi:hypothetical protein